MHPQIGIISNSLDRDKLTGPGVYLHYMLQALLSLPRAKEHVSLVHYQPSKRPLFQHTTDLIVPRAPILSEIALGKKGFDILHYNSLPTLRPFYFLPARKVLTLHGMEPLLFPHLYARYIRVERTYIWPTLVKKIDQIITVSEFVRQTAIKYWKVPPERICTIHSGLQEHFRPQSQQALSALREQIGEEPYLLHVSNYLRIRNTETVLRAFAKLKQAKFPHRLIMIGGRWESSPIPALISELQLSDSVIFAGYIDNAELPVWYSGADAFITLSLHESFCFPAVEAMACGCPVIALNRTAFPEIVGDAGLLLDDSMTPDEIATAVANLLEDETLANMLRERGLQQVTKFNWHENAQKTWQLYQNLVG